MQLIEKKQTKEKNKALSEFQEIEKKKTLAEEQRKKVDDETLKVKEEKDKALVEFQKIEKENERSSSKGV